MPACVCVFMLCLCKVFLRSSFHQKSRLISLQLESLITAKHGSHKMEAAETDVLMN